MLAQKINAIFAQEDVPTLRELAWLQTDAPQQDVMFNKDASTPQRDVTTKLDVLSIDAMKNWAVFTPHPMQLVTTIILAPLIHAMLNPDACILR